MMPVTDPYRRFHSGIVLQVGACALLTVVAALWAWRAPPPAAPPAPAVSLAASGATPKVALDPAAWRVELWRPFNGEAPTSPSAPLAIKVFSILKQGEGLTAALSLGNNPGLTYVQAGDTCNGYAVLRVEADAVVLRVNGQEQRLELGR